MKIFLVVALFLSIFCQPVIAQDSGMVKKYAVIWESGVTKKPDFNKHIQAQAKFLLQLWKDGIIENVYLNPQTSKNDESGGMVFFIKANNEKEIDRILAQMPFIKHKVSKYRAIFVGFLWLGPQPIEYK